MVLGMAIVGIFLLILVEVIKIQAKIIDKFFPEKAPIVVVPTVTQTKEDSTEEAHHVAAIIAAVTEFRKKS
jgi:oxaloacetate decarboxylase gamma subunit